MDHRPFVTEDQQGILPLAAQAPDGDGQPGFKEIVEAHHFDHGERDILCPRTRGAWIIAELGLPVVIGLAPRRACRIGRPTG